MPVPYNEPRILLVNTAVQKSYSSVGSEKMPNTCSDSIFTRIRYVFKF